MMLTVNRQSPEAEEDKSRTSGGTQMKKGGEDGELEDKVPVLMMLYQCKSGYEWQ